MGNGKGEVTTNFAPVLTTDFTPAPQIEDPEKAQARRSLRASQLPGGGYSTMGYSKGEDPTQAMASGARYGIPALYGLLSLWTGGASVPGSASVVTLSETLASEIEKMGQDQSDIDTMLEFLMSKGESLGKGATAGVLDLMFAGGGYVASRFVKGVGRRMMVPKTMGEDTATAQRVLSELPPKKFGLGNEEVYGLTPGRLNRDAQNWIVSTEGALREAIGSRTIFNRIDKKNIQAIVDNHLMPYLKEAKQQMEPEAFADFLEKMIGKISNTKGGPNVTGDAWSPVTALRKAFYNVSDSFLAEAAPVDASAARDFLLKHGNRGAAGKAWRRVNVADVSGERLLPGIKKLEEEGMEEVAGFTSAWESMTLPEIDAAIQSINKGLRSTTDKAERTVLTGLKDKLTRILESGLSQDGKEAYKLATEYYGKGESIMYNKSMDAIRRTLGNSPETVIEMFTDKKFRLSRLRALKETFKFSYDAAAERGEAVAAQTFDEWWDKSILGALRKRFVDETLAPGNSLMVDPQAFTKAIEKWGTYGDKYLQEIFPATPPQLLKDAATALTISSERPQGARILVGLLQGGQVMRLLGAGIAVHGYETGDVKTLAGGTAMVFLGPIAFARILASPRRLRMLTEGISSGPQSTAFRRFIREVAAIKTEEATDLHKLPPEAVSYYMNKQPLGKTKQPTMGLTPTEGLFTPQGGET